MQLSYAIQLLRNFIWKNKFKIIRSNLKILNQQNFK